MKLLNIIPFLEILNFTYIYHNQNHIYKNEYQLDEDGDTNNWMRKETQMIGLSYQNFTKYKQDSHYTLDHTQSRTSYFKLRKEIGLGNLTLP